ncbi:PHP domain-containing protein [Flavicella sp.]|uniref:PHP domain-containing protein n=1 Tax=Flavicella sp. TaxID=2957742 RepID=UPI0030172B7E
MFLNTHTYFSLRYGTIAPNRLLEMANKLGIKAMAFTDINSTSSCLELVRLAKKFKIKPILGVDFRNGSNQKFILLAKNNKGFESINTYLSHFLHQSSFKIPKQSKYLKDTFVIYPFSKNLDFNLKPHEFIGVQKKDLGTLKFLNSTQLFSKMVVLQTVSFENKKDFNTHRLLRAIDNNTLLSKLPYSEQGNELNILLPVEILKKMFSEYPVIIKNTEALLEKCSITFNFSEDLTKNHIRHVKLWIIDCSKN